MCWGSWATIYPNTSNFDVNITCVGVDGDPARTSLKELYSDLILRYCGVADNQFRKDLMKNFGLQKTEALRKRVVETQKPKDSTLIKLSMTYILQDKSKDKISSHLKLNLIDIGTSVFKSFSKKELLLLSNAYDLSMTVKKL